MLIYSFNLDLIDCAAIYFLPDLLRESREHFFHKTSYLVVGTDFTTYDCIANEECAYDIKIESTIICRCNDLVRAFVVIIALHYVFNVTYSKKIEADVARDN